MIGRMVRIGLLPGKEMIVKCPQCMETKELPGVACWYAVTRQSPDHYVQVGVCSLECKLALESSYAQAETSPRGAVSTSTQVPPVGGSVVRESGPADAGRDKGEPKG